MLGAVLIGILAGSIGWWLMPRSTLRFLVSVLLGVAGSVVGFVLFTEVLRIGDNQQFDLAGSIGAASGAMILLALYRLGLTDNGRRLAP